MANFPNNLGPGAFLPTTDVYDTQAIYELDIKSQDFKEFLVRLRQSTNNIALVVNIKDSGYYVLTEFVNGQAFFPNPALSSTTQQAPVFRQVFRKVINFGALPNAGTKSVAHGININSTFTFTRIYATASDTTGLTYIPIPYISLAGDHISLDVDSTNVTISTTIDRTNYNVCYVILEYLKQ